MALADLAGAAVGAAEYMVRAMRRGVVLDEATLARVEADLDRYRRAAGVNGAMNGGDGDGEVQAGEGLDEKPVSGVGSAPPAAVRRRETQQQY
jgi:hypothetical protein